MKSKGTMKMTKGAIAPVENVKTNNTKGYISARTKAEQAVMDSQPKERPVPTQKLLVDAQKMFDGYLENYPELNIKHSQLLTTLILSTMEYNKIAATIRRLPVLDSDRPLLEKRAQAYSKEVTALLKDISNIKTNLLKQAIDIAKVEVAEQQVQSMSKKEEEPENTLLSLVKNQKAKKGS